MLILLVASECYLELATSALGASGPEMGWLPRGPGVELHKHPQPEGSGEGLHLLPPTLRLGARGGAWEGVDARTSGGARGLARGACGAWPSVPLNLQNVILNYTSF
jgi:hypothetical protein